MWLVADQPQVPYPPVYHSMWWYVVGAACVLLILVLVMVGKTLLRKVSSHIDQVPPELTEQLRAEAVAELDDVADRVYRGELSSAAAHREISGIVRRFVGTVTNTDIDFEGLSELSERAIRTRRLRPVLTVVAQCYGPAFDPALAHKDPTDVIEKTRKVLTEWS